MASLNANWTVLNPVQLRNIELYTDLKLQVCDSAVLFAACEFGGPIAIAVPRINSNDDKWDVAVMTSSGIPLIKEPIEAYNVMTISWTKGHRVR
ncbi:hypothetical protein QR680_012861 [Steinernema hermaphroditum]|uniref:Uncharacterized protein n=1 Tax=Steinernema hermaphroditum TaxID=289476 RepID=A0AA39I5V2_9BILA|nr:hypothetical protein QR680_012861 [Steinernema hermaphroditum]